MRAFLMAAGLLFFVAGTAHADCCLLVKDPFCSGDCVPIITMGSSVTITGCDSNEKTPSESIQCKLAYWEKQYYALKKERDALDIKLDKAAERIGAFSDLTRRR